MDCLTSRTSAVVESDSSSSVGEDDRPDTDNPLEYARFYGLCRDYELEHPLQSQLVPLPPKEVFQDMEEPLNLTSWMRAENVEDQVRASLNERLDVDKETATFLLTILAAGKQNDGDELSDVKNAEFRPLRLELPVLARDHEVEMIALRRRNDVRLTGSRFEPFTLDVEKDEGATFSKADVDNKHRLDRCLANEKLDISKETLEFLRDVGNDSVGEEVDYANEAYEAFKVRLPGLKYEISKADVVQKRKSIRTSPPLLPVTPPYSPSDPPPEAMQIDMTSTPEDLISKDAADAEKQLLEEDEEIPATPAHGETYSAEEVAAAIDAYIAIPSSSSPLSRKRLRDVRVEPPLTPRHESGGMASDEVSTTTDNAKKLRLDPDVLALLPDADATFDDDSPEPSLQRCNALLKDAALLEAESVDQHVRNEQLVGFDTTLRVKVPELQAVQMQAPWETSQLSQNNKALLVTTQQELLRDIPKWGGASKIERSLPWAPFSTHLGKINPNEEFDDGSLERHLTELDFDDGPGDVDVHALIAADDQLRTLQERDSDDEEIAPVVKDEGGTDDSAALVPEETQQQQFSQSAIAKPEILDLLRKKQLDITDSNGLLQLANGRAVPAQSPTTMNLSSNMMQTDSIAHFMHLRGKAPKPNNSAAHLVREEGHGKNLEPSTAVVQNVAPTGKMVAQASIPECLATPPCLVPVPEVKPNKHSEIQIIVSSIFITNRRLIRQLQSTLPGINFIERDTTIVARQHHNQIVHGEADITISPSTAIITTSLQKLKQKPLPGQTSFHGLRDRIASTAPRYERLTVLVSEGSSIPTEESKTIRPLDQLDCKALADLTAWTVSLEIDVQILYIPGGEMELAHWLAATISHCGITDGSVQLLPDETMWERWLRKAGLNAFAAQAILGQLKSVEYSAASCGSLPASIMVDGRWSEPFGLAAFLGMSIEERVERFALLLGGERVLKRVSRVVDGDWAAKVGDC